MDGTQPQSLFLADSDDEDVLKVPRHDVPPVIDIDIDAIFADAEDDQDDLFTFKPLAPALDTEALRREAESRHKNNAPDLTLHAILPSSSPPRDTGADQSAKSKQGETGGEAKKERRKPARLDEGRLLGPNGFPLLIKNTKNFKIKGKGHEATDLNRLLQVYQFWTHEMYPPGQFRDTVERVEKVCHSRRMNVSLSVWRDEAHGLIHGKKVEDDETIELDDEGTQIHETVNSRSTSGSVRAEYASSSSPPQTRPPSSEVEDDDFDIDAVIREEVERNARKRAEAGEEPDHSNKGKGKMVVAEEDEYDALWNETDPIPSVPASVESSLVGGESGDDDMTMWDAVDALEERPSTPAKPPTTYHVDDDEDMWDVVQDMENVPIAKAPPIVEAASTENTTVVDQPPPLQNDDDDWEDMYV